GGRSTQTPSPIRARTSSAAMGRRRLPSATNGVPQPSPDSVSDTIHPTHRTARTSRQPVMIQRTLSPRAGATGSFDMMSLRGRGEDVECGDGEEEAGVGHGWASPACAGQGERHAPSDAQDGQGEQAAGDDPADLVAVRWGDRVVRHDEPPKAKKAGEPGVIAVF